MITHVVVEWRNSPHRRIVRWFRDEGAARIECARMNRAYGGDRYSVERL